MGDTVDTKDLPVRGGLGEVKEVTDEVREVLEKVRASCEEKAGKKFELFEPVCYRSQTVSGTNFFVKVKVAAEDYIHVRVHRSISQEVSLSGIQQGQKKDSEVEYFD
nr:cystatin 1 [Dermanyssus gallinae]